MQTQVTYINHSIENLITLLTHVLEDLEVQSEKIQKMGLNNTTETNYYVDKFNESLAKSKDLQAVIYQHIYELHFLHDNSDYSEYLSKLENISNAITAKYCEF